MAKVARSHFCFIDGTFGGDDCIEVLHQTLMDGQDLFDVAEEFLNVLGCERALVRVPLLLSGLLENVLCAVVV